LTPIINADDFGRSTQINRAVIRAHQEGVLNSASLMVAGAAADEAFDLARSHPALAVGLHLVVVDGPAVLPPHRIPHLVNAIGQFANAPIRLGLKYGFSSQARSELTEEITAQFERFAASGLPLSHVDGHQHMHMHPVVFDIVLPLAKKFGAKRIRIVRDDLRLALRHDPRHALGKIVSTAIFAMLSRRCRKAGAVGTCRTYGFFQSGAMTEQYVLAAIQKMPRSTELYFHPTEGDRLDELGPNPQDLRTLLSPEVRRQIGVCQLLFGNHDALAVRQCHMRAEELDRFRQLHASPVAPK
jgi:hopanoid biosynthesis associated protein HpnK